MENLPRSEAVLELGKRLAAQLRDGDLMGAWMAHHLADLMTIADQAPMAERAGAFEACRAVIFELWARRDSFPTGRRPMPELDPILRALASFDVDGQDYRYYPQALRAGASASVPEETAGWLELASGLDYTARMLIRHALHAAASGPALEAAPWLELARAAGADEGVEVRVVSFLDNVAADEEDHDVVNLADKVERLRAFIALAEFQAETIEAQIAASNSRNEGQK